MQATQNFGALIVEDQRLVQHCIGYVLKQNFINIRVHEATTAQQALAILGSHKVDIALLDIRLPDMNGAELAKTILRMHPEVKLMVVTQYHGEALIRNMFRVGVNSFILKSSSSQVMCEAVMTVLDGGSYLQEELKYALIPVSHIPSIEFTRSEAQVLLHLKMGRSSKEISKILKLAENTISSYREDMLKKTRTLNTAQLISYAYENGILS